MNKILIGLCGSKTFENKAKIKMFIFKLKEQTDSHITIVGMGDRDGADKYIKKYALEFGYDYKEMNPLSNRVFVIRKCLHQSLQRGSNDKLFTKVNSHL